MAKTHEVQEESIVEPQVTHDKDNLEKRPYLDAKEQKKIVHRVDWRLLPILGALYSISLIDRTNMSNARVSGMAKELVLTIHDRYSIALLVFFVPYFLFELPSNMILVKLGCANWLSFLAVSWGAVMLGMGFVKDWRLLTMCRVLLGTFEAGFFPGCVFLVSCWYTRYEVQKRLAAFYLFSVLIGGFANILAFGIVQGLNGKHGLLGWRWIFIVEGAITIGIGVISRFLIVDFPILASKDQPGGFLTQQEVGIINERIEADRGDAVPDDITWAKAGKHLTDWKVWCFALLFMSSTMPAYAFAYFTPVILGGMGYSGQMAQLLSAPPAVSAVIIAFTFSYFADKTHMRSPAIISQALITIVGLALVAYAKSNGVRYFGIFLGVSGCQGNIPAVIAFQSNNIRTHSKRAVTSALQIGFGAIGGIMASTVFREKDYPRYVPGIWVTMALQILIIAITGALVFYFQVQNKKVREGRRSQPIEGLPGFIFTM